MGTRPKLRVETSWDDGHELDHKVIRLLKLYDLPGTFYLVSHSPMVHTIDAILENGFEVGGHTMSHPLDLKRLSPEELEWEIGANKRYLEMHTGGKPVKKFCYPRGRYNDQVVEAVKRHKYQSARTTRVCELGEGDNYKLGTSVQVFPRREYKGRHWLSVAQEYAIKAAKEGGTFHIWGHSWEIEMLHQWQPLEELFKWLDDNFEIINRKI